jgi:hypothetical protein
MLGVGLLGEWAHRRAAGPWPSGPRRPRDSRPADGRVDIAALAGVRREPNEHDPRFGRFVGMAPEPAAATTSGLPAGGSGGGRVCPPLLGRVTLVSLYLGYDGARWTDDEVAAAQGALLRAGSWIEREARRWGAAVNVEIADTYLTADVDDPHTEQAVGFDRVGDEVVAFEEGEETRVFAALTRAAVGNGFRDAVDLVRTVEGHLATDAAVWLVHPLRCGVSRAFPHDREGAILPGVSLAVCYVREAPFPEPLKGPATTDPVTVVHEMLHLFGATDKYGHALKSYAPRAVTGREVMRLSVTRLERLQVDPLTALEIGWSDRLAPETPTTAASPRGSRRSSDSQGHAMED